jgi:hypothetical protein
MTKKKSKSKSKDIGKAYGKKLVEIKDKLPTRRIIDFQEKSAERIEKLNIPGYSEIKKAKEFRKKNIGI